jgi:hypothetical protein
MVYFKIISANIRVMPLAIDIDNCFVKMPYMSHKDTPMVNIRYMLKEIPEVFLVLITLIACGKKERVVKAAAIKPIDVIIVTLLKILVFINNFSITVLNPYLF